VRIVTDSRDELAQLAGAANAMIDDLAPSAAREPVRVGPAQLVAAVSHDLRTPITSLRLLAEAVSDEHRRRRAAAGLSGSDAHPHRRAQRPDRRSVRVVAPGGRDINWSLERVALGELVARRLEAMRLEGRDQGGAVTANVPETLTRPGPTREDPARAVQPHPETRSGTPRLTAASWSSPSRSMPDRGWRSPTAGRIAPRSATKVFKRVLPWRQPGAPARTARLGLRWRARSSKRTGASGWPTARRHPRPLQPCRPLA